MRKRSDRESQNTGVKPEATGAVSRRSVIAGAAMIGVGGLCIASTRAVAQSKQKQADVQYQSSPKGADKCAGCAMFQAPDACQAVEGPISPEGWCSIYSPKA
ncbi:high potential iron sulfur protein [Chelatococcus sambhunathii]|uniref:High potential iron sulfur protein n=1 Tax=Chelatococcus sambhunathii TaxID=363953 RepID=A0ABU1DHQ5_9HYPH|nr:high potential iron sulfur protein [Chelatococcus sambhunathii]MDR4307555.1 high potential iron sulfur protein [Chelatococcus sambhunathii]